MTRSARNAVWGRKRSRDHGRIGKSLPLGGVRGRYGIDNRLCLFLSNLLIILQHVPQMIPTRIVCLTHAHRVMREVDIAVVAEEFWHPGLQTTFQKKSAQGSSRSQISALEGARRSV